MSNKYLRRFRCVLNSPSILLVPNGLSTTELLDAVYLPIIGFRMRLMAVVSDKLLKLTIAFGARNVEPIIISFSCCGEIKSLAARADTTNIDYLLDFHRLWFLIDTNSTDNAWNG